MKMSDLKEKEEKEIKSYGCDLCKISYISEKDLKEHLWSLIHHTKIEDQKRNSTHTCTLCLSTCKTIPEYRKHLLDTRHKRSLEKFNLAEENGEQYVYSDSEKEDENVPHNEQYRNGSNNRQRWWGKGGGPHPNQPPSFWNVPPWQRPRNFNNFVWHNKEYNNRFDNDSSRKLGPTIRHTDTNNQPRFYNREDFDKDNEAGFQWKSRHDRESTGRDRHGKPRRSNKGNSKEEGFENPYWHSNDDWHPSYHQPSMMMSMQGDQPWQNNDHYYNYPGYRSEAPHFGFERGFPGYHDENYWKNYYSNNTNSMFNYEECDSPEGLDDDQQKQGNSSNIEPTRCLYTDFEIQKNQQIQSKLESEKTYYESAGKGTKHRKRQLEIEDNISQSFAVKRFKKNKPTKSPKTKNGSKCFSKTVKDQKSKKHIKMDLKPTKNTKRISSPHFKNSDVRGSNTSKASAVTNRKTRVSKNKASLNISKGSSDMNLNIHADGNVTPENISTRPEMVINNSEVAENVNLNPISFLAPIPSCNTKVTASGKKYIASSKSQLSVKPENRNKTKTNQSTLTVQQTTNKKLSNAPKPSTDVNVRLKKTKNMKKKVKIGNCKAYETSEALVTSSSSITKDINDEDDVSLPQITSKVNSRSTKRQHSGEPSTTSDVGPSDGRDVPFLETTTKTMQLSTVLESNDSSRKARNMSGDLRLNTNDKGSKKALTKETLIKLVNSPRSRKDRMQLANMLRTHAQSHNRLDSTRINCDDLDTAQVNHDLAGLCESLGGSEREVPTIKIEDLTPEIQLQIAQLIEDDSELGAIEQSLLAAIDEGKGEQDLTAIAVNIVDGSQSMVSSDDGVHSQMQEHSFLSSEVVVKTEPIWSKSKSCKNTSETDPTDPTDAAVIPESNDSLPPSSPKSCIARTETPQLIPDVSTTTNPVKISHSANTSNMTSSTSTRPNFVSHPYYPGPYPFPGYPPPGFHPFHPSFSMPFPNQPNMFNPAFSPSFSMYASMRNQPPASSSAPDNPPAVSSHTDPSQQKLPTTPSVKQSLNMTSPVNNYDDVLSSIRTPFNTGESFTTFNKRKCLRTQATSPIKFSNGGVLGDSQDISYFDCPTREEKSVLMSVLHLTKKEENLQCELSFIDTKVARLHRALKQTLKQISECQTNKDQLIEEQKNIRYRKIHLMKSCLKADEDNLESKPSSFHIGVQLSSLPSLLPTEDIKCTGDTVLIKDLTSSPTSHISLESSPIKSSTSKHLSASISSDFQSQLNVKPVKLLSLNSNISISSSQTDPLSSVMGDSTDSCCSVDEVIVESDCTTEDEATDFIKLMDNTNSDIKDTIKTECVSTSDSTVVEIFESPTSVVSSCESPFEKIQKISSPNICTSNVHDNIVFSPSKRMFTPINHSVDLITSQKDVQSLNRGIFVSPGKNQTCTFSPAKSVQYLRQRSVSESDIDSRNFGDTSPNICGRPVKYLGAISGSPDGASILKQLAANFSGVTSISCLPMTQPDIIPEEIKSRDKKEDQKIDKMELNQKQCKIVSSATEKHGTHSNDLMDCSIILEKLEMSSQTQQNIEAVSTSSEMEQESSSPIVSPTKNINSKTQCTVVESCSESTQEEENLPLASYIKQKQAQYSQYSQPSELSFNLTVEFTDSDSEDSDLLEIGSGYEAYLQSVEDIGNTSSCDKSSTLKIKHKPNKAFNGPTLTISGIQFDKDSLYVCYRGYGVNRYAINTGKLINEYETNGNTINCMALGSLATGETRLFMAGVDFCIMAYDVDNSSPLCVIDVNEEVKCLHSDYGHVYCGLVNGMLEVVTLQTNKKIDTYQSDDQCIHCITSAREGGFKLLCVSSQDATITVYDAFSGLPVRVLEGHSKTAFSVKVNITKVYSGSGDKTVMVHDLHTGELEYVYKDHKGMVSSIFVEGNLLFSASYDRLVRCYDTETQTLICMYYGAGHRVVSRLAVYNGQLYTGNRDGEISVVSLDHQQLWSCQCGNCKHIFAVKDHLIHHVLSDHIEANSFMAKCTWRGCKQWFSTQRDTKNFESHFITHLQ